MNPSKSMIEAAKKLSTEVNLLKFSDPVSYVYNPLDYAWESHQSFIQKFGSSKKRVVFMGMNPGPWGMSQTGVPFGEISFVRDWMGIEKPVKKPNREHPKRPIVGFECTKSEVSGRRLWGLFAERYQDPFSFFDEYFVLNYCPLVFMEESSRNRTPDKLPAIESSALFSSCDQHLRRCIEVLEPNWIVGVGGFAQTRAKEVLSGFEIRHGKLLHPSPASPAANRGWAEAATKQLTEQGIW